VKALTCGQCDARPTVTFPAAGHHCPLTGTKLDCLVTEAHACEQLSQGFLGGPEPSPLQQPVVTTPVIDQFNLANSEVDKVIDEFLQNQISVSSMTSGD